MCTGQSNLLTALVRLNAKIQGHKTYSVTVNCDTAAVRQFAIGPVILSVEQGLLLARWHPPGPTRIFRQLSFKHGATTADVALFYLIKSSAAIARLQPVSTSL